jgi:hypothetical protein
MRIDKNDTGSKEIGGWTAAEEWEEERRRK